MPVGDQLIFYYKDGRLPYVCPNNQVNIDLQESINSAVLDHYEVYDPNKKPKVVIHERMIPVSHVDKMKAELEKLKKENEALKDGAEKKSKKKVV